MAHQQPHRKNANKEPDTTLSSSSASEDEDIVQINGDNSEIEKLVHDLNDDTEMSGSCKEPVSILIEADTTSRAEKKCTSKFDGGFLKSVLDPQWHGPCDLMKRITETQTGVISLDSLYIELCSHYYLNWTAGGQSIVLVAMMEKVLQQLFSMHANFKLVWFSKLASIYENDHHLMFMLNLLKAHLKSLPAIAKCIYNFIDINDTKWKEFIKTSPALIFSVSSSFHNTCQSSKPPEEIFELFDALILQCLKYNIATVELSNLEININIFNGYMVTPELKDLSAVQEVELFQLWENKTNSAPGNEMVTSTQTWSSNLQFWISALLYMPKVCFSKFDYMSEEYSIFCQKILLYGTISTYVPMQLQHQTVPCGETLTEPEENSLLALFLSGSQLLENSEANLPNLHNGLFFCSISEICNQFFKESVSEFIPENLYVIFSKACTDLNLQPIWGPDENQTKSFQHGSDLSDLFQNETKLSDKSCCNFKLYQEFVGIPFIPNPSAMERQNAPGDMYLDIHHWHSGKLVIDEETSGQIKKQQEAKQRSAFHKNRGNQMYARFLELYGESLEGHGNYAVNFGFSATEKTKKPSKKAAAIIEQNNAKKHQEMKAKEKKKIEEIVRQCSNQVSMQLKDAEENCNFDENKALVSFHQMKVISDDLKKKFKSTPCVNKKPCSPTNAEHRLRVQCVPIFGELIKLLKQYFEHLPDNRKRTVIQTWLHMGFSLQEAGISGPLVEAVIKEEQLLMNKYTTTKMNVLEYQLCYGGEYLAVQIDSQKDERVQGFQPDAWQRKLLDVVDKNQSALIIAPTSSGKTFISYYCIEKVLRDKNDDNGVVVYVSPTKALVNQVAATVYSRFKNKELKPGLALVGVFTRDYQQNKDNCRVLMTVPQCLEILLLSPASSNQWRSKIRYVIFDEVHCIGGGLGDIKGREVWEHTLMLIQCPFLALSATIKDPQNLYSWLQAACKNKMGDHTVTLVTSNERHSELQTMLFTDRLIEINPIALADAKSISRNEFSDDQFLTAHDTFGLYKALVSIDENKTENLSPKQFFTNQNEEEQHDWLTRTNLRLYEKALKKSLANFSKENVEKVQQNLHHNCLSDLDPSAKLSKIAPLISSLKKKRMLPAICFSDNRRLCEVYSATIYDWLVKAENNYCKGHAKKIKDDYLQHQKIEKMQKQIKNHMDDDTSNKKAGKNIEAQTDLLSISSSDSLASKIRKQYTLGRPDINEQLLEQLEERILLKDGNTVKTNAFLKFLRRGIAYHHSGMSTAKKRATEILFRAGMIGVVFSTSTLALGIHMPCKSVIFGCDSPFLDSLSYRQMAGRAGRRGLDTKGNIIFLGLGVKKIQQLVSSKLPSLVGNIPITVSFVLRLLTMISSSQSDQKVAMNSAMTLLKNPFIISCYPKEKEMLEETIKRIFSFSCHLLFHMGLMNKEGKPIGLAGIVNHLSFHEPGNLIFIYLLQKGIFHKLCDDYEGEKLFNEIILILSYLFTNTVVTPSQLNRNLANSKLILDPLDEEIAKHLKEFTPFATQCFAEYVSKFLAYKSADYLPLSGTALIIQQGKKISDLTGKLFGKLQERQLSFQPMQGDYFQLTGNNDTEINLLNHTLVKPIANYILFDSRFIPVKPYPLLDGNGKALQLNSYAMDFWRHGIPSALVVDNGLMEEDAFNLVKDFGLVIKAISVALNQMGPEDDAVVRTMNALANEYLSRFNKVYGLTRKIF